MLVGRGVVEGGVRRGEGRGGGAERLARSRHGAPALLLVEGVEVVRGEAGVCRVRAGLHQTVGPD